MIEIYLEGCNKISADEKNNMYSFDDVALNCNDYSSRFKELDDVTPRLRLEGHEE